MGKEHHLKSGKFKADTRALPLNFLLGGSDNDLSSFELARLAAVANIRKGLIEAIDSMVDELSQAAIARWFRAQDRNSLKRAIENEETPEEWAKRMIRDGQRSEEELIPRPSLPPGAAHLAAAVRYQQRNNAEGKCSLCPQPLDPTSQALCTKHLIATRSRYKPKNDNAPGSIDYLYHQETPPEARPVNALVEKAIPEAQKQRAILADLGIPPERAAVRLDAAKEALLQVMPADEKQAQHSEDLWKAALIPSLTTGERALGELLAEGKIQRTRKGVRGDAFRYWKAESKPQSRKPAISGKLKNKVLLQTLRGEEPKG